MLSPILFNAFLESFMSETQEDHQGIVSICGRTVTNLRFADDIDRLAGSEQELINLVRQLDRTLTAYGMNIRQCK